MQTIITSSGKQESKGHNTTHQYSGSDELNLAGLENKAFRVDRGDLAAPDWSNASFIKDGTWRELDASAILPAGTIAAEFEIYLQVTTPGLTFALRTKGNVNGYNAGSVTSLVANGHHKGFFIVTPDANRKFEYYADPRTWTNLSLSLRAYWKL